MPVSVLIHPSLPALRQRTRQKGADDPAALTFDGSRIVIGRGALSEVRLPEVSVSHRHASIRASGSEYVLVDEGSTNGTVVGGVRLSPHTPRTLRTGDLIRVGRVWLEVRFDQKPATRDLSAATRDVALALVAEAMAAMGDDIVPRVLVVEGADMGAALPLAEEGRVYIAGRSAEADLPLEDAEASRQHLQIVRRANVVLVRDMGSKNPAQLGATPLSPDREVPWRGQAVIRIGATVLALTEPVATALAELEGAEDERVALEDSSPPPSGHGTGEHEADTTGAPARPEGDAGPSTKPAAPVAAGPIETTVKVYRPRRRRWSGTDFAVVVAALGVIALSVAGLYWLLRP